jgi:hypothetical protein
MTDRIVEDVRRGHITDTGTFIHRFLAIDAEPEPIDTYDMAHEGDYANHLESMSVTDFQALARSRYRAQWSSFTQRLDAVTESNRRVSDMILGLVAWQVPEELRHKKDEGISALVQSLATAQYPIPPEPPLDSTPENLNQWTRIQKNTIVAAHREYRDGVIDIESHNRNVRDRNELRELVLDSISDLSHPTDSLAGDSLLTRLDDLEQITSELGIAPLGPNATNSAEKMLVRILTRIGEIT